MLVPGYQPMHNYQEGHMRLILPILNITYGFPLQPSKLHAIHMDSLQKSVDTYGRGRVIDETVSHLCSAAATCPDAGQQAVGLVLAKLQGR